MSALIPFFVFCQALGASCGTYMAVWSEFAYLRAMRDGKITVAEQTHLRIIARGLRFGMVLLLLSSLGLVITDFVLQVTPQPALSQSYWTATMLVAVILTASWALSRRRISFALGSAISFTAWWFLVDVVFGQFPVLSFGASVAFFVIATAIFYVILTYGRFLALRKA